MIYKVFIINPDEVHNLKNQLNGIEVNAELFAEEENLDDIVDEVDEEEKQTEEEL